MTVELVEFDDFVCKNFENITHLIPIALKTYVLDNFDVL